MFIPKLFKQENPEEIRQFIEENSFAILTSQVNHRPWATHIPLYLETNKEGKEVLTGHIARANQQWKSFAELEEVLAIFPGPHAYISSSWYNHANVPTWNYTAVHVYGKVKIIEGDNLLNHLKKLVDKYEKHVLQPVSLETMPADVLDSNIKGIIGFEIEITEIQAINKLSQNRDEYSHQNIIKELEKSNDTHTLALAGCMRHTGVKINT